MGRLKKLEDRIASLESALQNITFISDAPTVTVEAPIPAVDSNGAATGQTSTGYLQIKTGPTGGKMQISNGGAVLIVQ